MAELLGADAIEQKLTGLTGWEHDSDAQVITRTWERKGFNGAMQLANVIAWVANQANHHPNISVHDYNRITVTSTTHDAGGITDHDMELARRINTTVGDI